MPVLMPQTALLPKGIQRDPAIGMMDGCICELSLFGSTKDVESYFIGFYEPGIESIL